MSSWLEAQVPSGTQGKHPGDSVRKAKAFLIQTWETRRKCSSQLIKPKCNNWVGKFFATTILNVSTNNSNSCTDVAEELAVHGLTKPEQSKLPGAALPPVKAETRGTSTNVQNYTRAPESLTVEELEEMPKKKKMQIWRAKGRTTNKRRTLAHGGKPLAKKWKIMNNNLRICTWVQVQTKLH